MPQSTGSASRKFLQASRPPAEAPIPTIGNPLESSGRPRVGTARRLNGHAAVLPFRAELFGIARIRATAFDGPGRFTLLRLHIEISQDLDLSLFLKISPSREHVWNHQDGQGSEWLLRRRCGSPSDDRSASHTSANQGALLRWRPQFTQKPSEHVGLNGIDRYEGFLNMLALDALKRAYVELQASRHDAGRYHRTLALRTFLTFDRDCRSAETLRSGFRHGAYLEMVGARSSLSPVNARGMGR